MTAPPTAPPITPGPRLTIRPFGPFSNGVVDRANASEAAGTANALRRARGTFFSGLNRLSVRPGTRTVLTFKDDAGTPANVTSVCALVTFTDGALAVAHSTSTNKAYLYRLTADLTGWYNSSGVLQAANATPQPCAVIWSSITTPPDVTVAEGLGLAYIAMNGAMNATTLAFPAKQFTPPATIATITSDLDVSGGAEDLYFLGTVSFQQHLWAWGVGSGTTAANQYRPELARFSQPNFLLPFSPADSITVGDRVRSEREKIVTGAVAGSALFLATPFSLTRVTGYGRSSWYKEALDKSYGVAGLKALVARGDTLYYWSNRGPLRCQAQGTPEPLWPRIENAIASVINPQRIVAAYDEASDLVIFAYDSGSGVRTWCAYDALREVWVGPDDDTGVVISAAGTVAPIFSSTVAGSTSPAGAPTSASTTGVGPTTATANWTTGDVAAQTSIEYRRQGDVSWIATLIAAGVVTYTFTGLTAGVAYEWRAAHFKGGTYSSYLGPSGSTQFTTAASQLNPPTNLALSTSVLIGIGSIDITATWTNSGESGVSTTVEVDPGTGYAFYTSVSSPAASTIITVYASGTYNVRIKHTKTSYTDSNYNGPQSIAVTVN